MRIRELLEGKQFNDLDFVKQTNDKREIDYDLVEDLMHFMNHDDEVYRRHVFPTIANCIDKVSAKSPTKSGMFKPVVEKSYKLYIDKFPIRELPDKIDSGICEQVCDKMHEEVVKHVTDGKYKD
jgi:hypothetical protein